MQIISAAGEMRAMLPEVGVINSRGIVPHYRMCGKLTSSVAVSRAATGGWILFDTVVFDGYSCVRQAAPTGRLYIPQSGWYLTCVYLKSATGTAHDAALQIHNTYLSSHMAYKKWKLPAGSSNYPNAIALNAIGYIPQDHYVYVNWGTSQTITSLTGEANIGFAIWKIS